MVEVVVFWSYGLSSGLALAAGADLKNEKSFWNNPYFTVAMAWITLFFAPSGIYLLWNFPGWETMFLAVNHLSIPSWLVMLFSLTNITQGVLGFYFTWHFIRKGNKRAAWLQKIWSHAAMFFILVFGWDGSGYKRFFYAGTGEEWHAGKVYAITDFFSAEIFYTLVCMGVVLIPTYIWVIQKFRNESFRKN
jgi:hypothetical protein